MFDSDVVPESHSRLVPETEGLEKDQEDALKGGSSSFKLLDTNHRWVRSYKLQLLKRDPERFYAGMS